ncbi:MAG TPA: hypothetical protein PKN61_04450 [Acidobacteriota bacterium]|nr:hypothetical protein [Acidobacteriota bacterium]HNU00730.1 hypothetical protein [Acidobacteriota bacterium]HQP74259.1 hypothetical protein [Acidobacteriota bacterium]
MKQHDDLVYGGMTPLWFRAVHVGIDPRVSSTITITQLLSIFCQFLAGFFTEAMSKIKQPAGGRYRERQRAARGASRLDAPTPRHHSITVAAVRVTRPEAPLSNPRRWLAR